jgi:alpha-mannosidase
VTLWDEHTWGAFNSISEPDSPSVKAQWEFKRRYVLNAERESKAVEAAIVPRTTTKCIDVVNTLNWSRTDVVLLSAEMSKDVKGVETSDGRPVDAQRLSTGELAFRAEDVPGLGSRRYTLTSHAHRSAGSARTDGLTISNEFLRVKIDVMSGAVSSLVRVRDGFEFVNGAKKGLNHYLYVTGRDPVNAKELTNVSVRIRERGDLVASVDVVGDAPGCRAFASTIRLYSGIDRVDIVNRIDKLPIREKEGVHFAFPFGVPNGQPRYDVASSIVRTELDQLSGSCKNLFTAQSWVDISNDTLGVTVALISAPMFQVGAITVEQPWMKTIQQSSSVYSYVMNNYWHTNYKADQEGPTEFVYQLRPHGRFEELEAARFGLASRTPLIIVGSAAKINDRHLPFAIRTEAVLLSMVPRESGKAFLLFVYNPTSTTQPFSSRPTKGRAVSLYGSDSEGKAMTGPLSSVEIAPHGTKYLLIRMTK